MVKSILGRKVGMTQIFDEQGRAVPVTVVEAGPCVVTQKKTVESDGYEAIQVGYGTAKPVRQKGAKGHGRGHLNRPEGGHLTKNNLPPLRHLREIRMAGVADMNIGDEIRVDVFNQGDLVDVTGTSKGKGFAGVVKRYHWHGADMTHGSMIHRKPQSAGATDAARIFKNVGRPGHMGHERVTVKRLRVVRVDTDRNVLLIRGAVPGPNGTLLTIREAK
ncbi:MAG: 50S ribosomal protein L3 [Armatimonadota bacterium]